MRLPALTLTARSLRLDIRSLRLAMLRMGAVLILMIALAYAVGTASRYGAPGLRFFWWLLYLNVCLVTLVGLGLFPAIITEEKEQRTLGLLKLAGFDPVSILAGKSAGYLSLMVILLAVQLPFAMLVVTMGGVSTHQVLAGYVLLSSHALLVFAVALLASVVCQRTSTAMLLTTILVLAWLFGLPLLVEAVYPWNRTWDVLVENTSAWQGVGRIVETGFAEPLLSGVVTTHLTIAACLVLVAWGLFERSSDFVSSVTTTWTSTQRRRGRPDVGEDALRWKDYHFLAGGPLGVWVRIAIYAALWCLASAIVREGYVVGRRAFAFTLVVMFLDAVLMASRLFKDEVRWRTLPLLAISSLELWSWARGKFRGVVGMLIPGLVSLVFGLVVGFLTDSYRHDDRGMILFLVLYYCVNLWFFCLLAVHLSLIIPRGGMAGTLAAFLVGNFFVALLLQEVRPEAVEPALFVMSIMLAVSAWMLHARIGQKLKEVAAQ